MDDKPIAIKKVSEREILVGESRFCLGEDNILYQTVVGEMDEQTVLTMYKVCLELTNTVDSKVNTFIDIDQIRKPSIKARSSVYESLEDEKVGKVAFFCSNPVARVLVAFLIGTTRKKEIKLFKNKEEALQWLKE